VRNPQSLPTDETGHNRHDRHDFAAAEAGEPAESQSQTATAGGLHGRPIRVLLMISSMDGGGSERQTLLLLQRIDRAKFIPELYLLRRAGSLLGQVPPDVPVHSFEDAATRLPVAEENDRLAGKKPAGIGSRIRAAIFRLADRLPIPGKIHGRQVDDLVRLLRQRRIDVIYDRTFHMSLIAAPAAKVCGVPRVSTIVSPPSRAVPLNAGRFLAAKRRRLRRAYVDAGLVIAVSHPTAADAAKYYELPRRRFLVVPNPVDSERLDQIVADSPPPVRDARFTIACVGRMSVEKGQRELVWAIGRLKQSYPGFPLPRVWMIGDGPLRESLAGLARRLGVEDSIDFVGHVQQPAPWIAAADAVCVPSHFEGFPNVMLEAMALGVPVIARRIEVVRSLGRLPRDPAIRGLDYVATFDESGNRVGVDLARTIRATCINPTATRSRVNAARMLALKELSIDRIVPRIEWEIRKLVERPLAAKLG
jgi:glycosyltransferase involved in cell wall biosynthesis